LTQIYILGSATKCALMKQRTEKRVNLSMEKEGELNVHPYWTDVCVERLKVVSKKMLVFEKML
jgi:hypothetical protein